MSILHDGFAWIKENTIGNQDPIITEIDGIKHVTGQATVFQPPRVAGMLSVDTLEAVVAYLNGGVDVGALGDTKLIVKIVSGAIVTVTTEMNSLHKFRDDILSARSPEAMSFERIGFGLMQPVDELLVTLMTQFHSNADRDGLMKVLANITAERSVQSVDDGMTQSVVVKTDVATVERETVKNPVMLSPKATFSEVVVAPSPFIVRFKHTDHGALVALHDAGAGEWKLDATIKIAQYLNVQVENKNVLVL